MELLRELYTIHSPSFKEGKMRRFITSRLKDMGVRFSVDKTGNIYATKGNAASYPCIVAHMDEVHRSRPKGFELQCLNGDEVIVGFDRLRNRFCGTGADDKNGIWVVLKALESASVLKCVLFVGEETGCVGSSRAEISFFDDCRYVVQCDRRGGGDMVTSIEFTELCSEEFIAATKPEKFDYKPTRGMMTDILALKRRGLPVSCINLSCGYHNPHTDTELTRISELQNCLNFVLHIFNTCTEIYPHTQRAKPQRFNSFDWNSYSRF